MRVMVRLLNRAEELPGAPTLQWVNHERPNRHAIDYTRGKDKKTLYRDLLKAPRNANLSGASIELAFLSTAGTVRSPWRCPDAYAEVAHYRPLIEQVIEHTERRVIHGESVPAKEKLFSVFETHTDIIKKRNRDIQYGHKLNLTSGKSGLILDVVVETGNPADSERFLRC